LEVCLRHPEFPVVPNFTIDAFWHQHILDTRAYAHDCEAVFGEFLHHYPYFGLNGDSVERDDAFIETNRMYREIFGEDCTGMGERGQDCNMSACRADDAKIIKPQTMTASGCGHSGSGTGCGQGGRGGRTLPSERIAGKAAGCTPPSCHPQRADFGRPLVLV